MQHKIKPPLPTLRELIKQATKYIVSQGYSESAIKQHIRIWKRLQEFADLYGNEFFSLELASKFMKETYGINDIFKPDHKRKDGVSDMFGALMILAKSTVLCVIESIM